MRLFKSTPFTTHGPLLRTRLSRFAREEDGVMVVLTIYMFLIMLLVAGIGVDMMRFEMERTRLQNTLDRAVLAAADLDQTRPPKDVVMDYFDKSGLGDRLTRDDVEVIKDVGYRNVKARARTTVNTQFMHMTGVDTMVAPASGAAEEEIDNFEISLVLDISGSMRFGDRIGDLRPAARKFVSTLFDDGGDRTVTINLVPYAGQVNPGPYMFDKLNGVRYGATGPKSFLENGGYFPDSSKDISNMVLYFDRDSSDDEPYDYAAKIEDYPTTNVAKFNKDDPDDYIFFADAFMRRHDSDLSSDAELVAMSYKAGPHTVGPIRMDGTPAAFSAQNTGGGEIEEEYEFDDFYEEAMPRVSSCLEIGNQDFAHSGFPAAGDYDQTAHFMYWDIADKYMDWGWCPEDDTAIQYAQNDEDTLHEYIDNMRLHDGTGTHYGMKYALAALNPSSRDAFRDMANLSTPLVPVEFAERPLDWNAEGSRKFIVLMTDGKITDQHRPKDIYDPDNMFYHLDGSDRMRVTSKSDNVSNFYAICDEAKERDVVIYTIAFETDSSGRREMRNCASSPSHYFAVEGIEIEEAFKSIAASIRKLRLIQ